MRIAPARTSPRHPTCFLIIAIVVAMASGCTTTTSPPQSGFLGNYEGFEQDPNDPSLLWWEKDGFSWKNYDKVMLDPIIIYYHPEAQSREIFPDELSKLTQSFHQAVITELGEDYPIVEEPGPDVLRIRCAITDLIPTRAALNVVTSLLAFVPVDMGGAAIEVEFLNSSTGERLAAGVDQKLGTPIDGVTGFTRLGHAKNAFHDWAKALSLAFETDP